MPIIMTDEKMNRYFEDGKRGLFWTVRSCGHTETFKPEAKQIPIEAPLIVRGFFSKGGTRRLATMGNGMDKFMFFGGKDPVGDWRLMIVDIGSLDLENVGLSKPAKCVMFCSAEDPFNYIETIPIIYEQAKYGMGWL